MKTKTCAKCKKDKKPSCFYKNKSTKDGYNCYCKKCYNIIWKKYYNKNKEKILEKTRKWDKKNRAYRKNQQLKRFYDITLEKHEQMYLEQNGRCAICGNSVEYSKVHTDHNHVTGKVRGLLCHKCNHYLSAIENEEFREKAINYLNK